MWLYTISMIGTAVFAITGVLALRRDGIDVFGALVLGIVTALGGGTVRDLIIDAPVFWIGDFNYVWVAAGSALLTFFIARPFESTQTLLLYLDGFGAALFAIAATDKVLGLGFVAPVAVMLGVWTSIGGGIARDVLAGRPNLLRSREIYATPILLGCTLYILLRAGWPGAPWTGPTALLFIFAFRALVIRRGLQMPAVLSTHRPDR
jgi:uncharacterized membrane protein YeiH